MTTLSDQDGFLTGPEYATGLDDGVFAHVLSLQQQLT